MIMELLGEMPRKACQCRQAERVLGVTGCCVTPVSCVAAAALPARCDEPRWPAFVERPGRYSFEYRTTCDALPKRQDDDGCRARPLGWSELTAEICVGRPVIASLRAPGSSRGHSKLDEGFWLPYEEYAAGWDGLVHRVDFYGIRKE